MSDRYWFGTSIVRNFYPTMYDEPTALPSQIPAIYLFDSKPSRESGLAGTGAMSTIAAWTQDTSSPFGCQYQFPAQDDPTPSSDTSARIYWEALNFKTEGNEQTQTVIRSFVLERIYGPEAIPGATAQDLKDIYPAISAYLTDTQLNRFLSIAQDEIKIHLRAKGLEWARIQDLNRLKLALVYKTIALCALSEVKETNDRFQIRYETFTDKYNELMSLITLPYDSSKDGRPDMRESAGESFFIVDR